MAITSFPFDNQDTDETQFSSWSKELQDSGVVDSAGGTGFAVAPGTGMAVQVQPGSAIVRGHMVTSTAIETLTIPAAGAGTMSHRIVLRLDPTANAITLAVLAGASGAGLPALAQTATGIFEHVIAHVIVPPSTSSITAGMVLDQRAYVGHRLRVWTTDTRPSNARLGATGYNRSTARWEFWTGSAWADLVPEVEPGRVEMTMNDTAPAGWHLIKGQAISKTTNPVLFSRFGYTYGGSGDNFNLPNMQDRMPLQASGSKANLSVGGSDTAVLTVNNLPPHVHGMSHDHANAVTDVQGNHNHSYTAQATAAQTASGASNYFTSRTGATTGDAGAHQHNVDIPTFWGDTGSAGSGWGFSIQNYFMALNFIIKAG